MSRIATPITHVRAKFETTSCQLIFIDSNGDTFQNMTEIGIRNNKRK